MLQTRFAALLAPMVLVALLAGCASRTAAPVVDRSPGRAAPAAEASAGGYVVKKGDTLYSIALDHGLDYRDLVSWNALENPNLIRVGQSLRVSATGGSSPEPVAVARPVTQPAPVEVRPVTAPSAPAATGKVAPAPPPVVVTPATTASAGDGVDWGWPLSGKIIAPFVEGGGKGIDLAGRAGEPVLAAAAGTVSYVGSGLRGYGQLVVLRHNTQLLSVYAHNSRILVKEKQAVTKGQVIAEVGSSDTESPRLHFEIRQLGKPVDPLKYLPPR